MYVLGGLPEVSLDLLIVYYRSCRHTLGNSSAALRCRSGDAAAFAVPKRGLGLGPVDSSNILHYIVVTVPFSPATNITTT